MGGELWYGWGTYGLNGWGSYDKVSIKMKRDVGMACQKVHKQGRIKVMVNIQSLIHPYIFSQKSKDVGTRLCMFTITFILPCLCTFWHAIPTSLFIFNDFSFLFLCFFGNVLIYVVK